MKIFHNKSRPITENETFIRLIQAAREDKEFHDQIYAILSLNSFNRKSILNTFIDNMRLNNVSEDLIEALASLREDDVAEVALEVINGLKSEDEK